MIFFMLENGVGRAIRTLREGLGLTQGRLEKKGRIPGGSVSKWERGDRVPRGEQLQKLLKGLECNEVELWELAKNFEHAHYSQMAIEMGLRVPSFDVSVVTDQINRLLGLAVEEMPEAVRAEFHEVRQLVTTQITQHHALIDRVVALYEKLVRLSVSPDLTGSDPAGESR